MSDFNYRVRIPTNKEYDRFMDVTAEINVITHWKAIFSWVDNPKLAAKCPNRRSNRGYGSARDYFYNSADNRSVYVGFRPAFELLDNAALPAGISDSDVIVVGTLYMNGEPIRIPQNPVWNGDISDYLPGATLEFRPSLDDPAYQVQAIKCGDVFICDRCLLKNISYDDIEINIQNKVGGSVPTAQAVTSNTTKKRRSKEKMTVEQAVEILGSEDWELYDIELVKEACRMGAEALKEKLSEKAITVADLDPMMSHYDVFTAEGWELGSKSTLFGYLKPRYDKHGKLIGGKRRSFEDREYKSTPPWFKLQVAEIKNCSEGLGIFVKEK